MKQKGKPGSDKRLADDVRRDLQKQLSGQPGFVGAGIALSEDGQPMVLVMVESAEARVALQVPQSKNDVIIQTEIVGTPRKH
ncbi:MAG: hypothetical protein ACKVQA_16565 [Burkholderiales bacterium]